ncbi:MAG: FAD-dependent oxidoreductase [Vicinamibacterales bacterium]
MRIVILGGGIGGQVAATELWRRLPREHHVTVIERHPQHAFAPSFLWVMTGDRRPEQVTRPLRSLLPAGGELVEDHVAGIDVARRRVQLGRSAVDYDYLVVAVGAELAADSIRGLAAASHTLHPRRRQSSADRARDDRWRHGGDRREPAALQVSGGAARSGHAHRQRRTPARPGRPGALCTSSHQSRSRCRSPGRRLATRCGTCSNSAASLSIPDTF